MKMIKGKAIKAPRVPLAAVVRMQEAMLNHPSQPKRFVGDEVQIKTPAMVIAATPHKLE